MAIGRTLKHIVVREFWLDGIIESPCCPVFLQDEDKICWQLSFNDEYYEYDLRPDVQKFPKIGMFSGGPGMEYRDVKVSSEVHLVGKVITSFSTYCDRQLCLATLSFENDWIIQVTYNLKNETESFLIKQDI